MTGNLIEEMTWKQINRVNIAKDCPILSKIIDELDPDSQLTLIRVRYPFGSIIIQNDVLHLPINETETAPITDVRIDPTIREKLSYCSVPLGIISENTVEVFREIGDKVFSVCLSGPEAGLQLGVVEAHGSTAAYTVTSGARSLYMLPKISNIYLHKNLIKSLSISHPAPKKLLHHWHVFKDLYASPAFKTKWECEILFLTKSWEEKYDENSLEWLRFKNYLQKKGWEQSELGRRKVMLDVVWEQASNALIDKGLKANPYIVETLKHLTYISLGGISGCRPACGDDVAGPLNEIQTIYSDVYNLEGQIPTIMYPCNFNNESNVPVYYSMQTPMLLTSIPRAKSMASTIDDMRELIELSNHVFNMDYGNLKIDNTRFSELMNKVQFHFYHSGMYAYGKMIRPTSEMPETDPAFLYMPDSVKKSDAMFAENGAYIKGCVRVSRKYPFHAS